MKKITSMFLALVMALSLAIPAFATEESVTVDGSIQLPTVNVVLPTTASMILNPYEMTVNLNRDGTVTADDQIISTALEVKNLSNIQMQVGAKVVGTKSTRSEVDFAASSAASNTTDKKAFVYAVFAVGNTGDTINDPGVAAAADGTGIVVLDSTTTAGKEVGGFEFTATPSSTNTLAAVDPADTKNPAADGVLGFQFFGDMSSVTTWKDTDTLGATLTFKFTPVANNAGGTPPAGTVTATITEASGKTSIATGETASLTVALSGSKTIDSVVWSADDSGANVSLGGSTSATETVSWVSAGGSVTITATVTYDTTQTATATFTLGTT